MAADGDSDPLFPGGISYDDFVRDIAVQPDGKLIVVGDFENVVGIPFRRIVRLNLNGNVDPTFNPGTGAAGDARVVKLQPDGKVLLGGDFIGFNGMVLGHFVRLNADGSLDTAFNLNTGTGANFASSVNAIEIQPDGKILIGGSFVTFNGTAARGIVRLNSDGTRDNTFVTQASAGSATINAIACQPDGKILVGGAFTTWDNVGRNRIARLNTDSSLDLSFAVGNGASSTVNSLWLLPDGKVWIAGNFTQYNSNSAFGIVKANSDGSFDSTPATVSGTTVNDIGIQSDGKLILGGSFPNSPANLSVKRFDTKGAVDASFTSTETSTVNSVSVLSDNKVVIGGVYSQSTSVGGASPTGVLKLNTDGSRDNSYITRNGATSDGVSSIKLQPDGKYVITGGGDFIGGLSRPRLARYNADGTVDPTFNPTFSGRVIAVQPDGKYIIGGSTFGSTQGEFRFHRLNQDGSVDPTFSADSGNDPTGSSNVYEIVVQPDGKILVAGRFETINGISRQGMARLNSDGSVDPTFAPVQGTVQREVTGLALRSDGKIMMGGYFSAGPNALNLILRLNPDGSTDSSFGGLSPDNRITSLFLQRDGRVLITGRFVTINGVASKFVARLNTNGTVDQNFHPPEFQGLGIGFASAYYAISTQDSKVIVLGGFDHINNIERRGIARLNADGSFDPTYNTVMSSQFPSGSMLVEQADGKILLGGYFDVVDGHRRANMARLLGAKRSVFCDYDADGRTDISVFRPSNGAWFVQNSNGSVSINQWGLKSDLTVPADYDGDGKTDIAVWRPSNGVWFWINSSNGTVGGNQFGVAGDKPSPGDFDGDGKADIMVFRPSDGNWWVYRSSDAGVFVTQFGISEDKPTVGDYDGDGKADIAVFRPSNTAWYRLNSSNGALVVNSFGLSDDKPVAADYDGDGMTDIAIFRPSNGAWYWTNSSNGAVGGVFFGVSEDLATPGDYDGDGKSDPAVFRPSQSTWYLLRSTQGFTAQQFGAAGDTPTPNSFVR